jgi:hypothetical protein
MQHCPLRRDILQNQPEVAASGDDSVAACVGRP